MGNIDATNIYPRIECNGVRTVVKLRGRCQGATSSSVVLSPIVDGVVVDGATDVFAFQMGTNANFEAWLNVGWDFVPSVGSHRIGWVWRSTGASTATLPRSVSNPLQFVVEEAIQQDTNNGLS